MQTRIKKWGNSLAVRIPQTLARQLGLEPDLLVNMTVSRRIICTAKSTLALQ